MMRSSLLFAGLLAAGASLFATGPQGSHDEPADLVVINARIWTGDTGQPTAQAFAVSDGRFIAVGENAGVRPLIGAETTVIDAAGRRIVPGFIDTHVHLQNASIRLNQLVLRETKSREDLLAQVAAYAKNLAEDEWVLGNSWSSESWPDQRPPSAEELDEASGGRPVVLVRMDGHSLIASASALRYANITKEGPTDPPGGTIGRRADGTPTGAIFEQAMGIVTRHAQRREVDRVELMRRTLREVAKNGVTQVGALETPPFIEDVLVAMDERDELTVRVAATISGAGDELRDWRPWLEWADQHRAPSSLVRVLGFKGYMDGSLGSRTAWMHQPYEDNHLAEDKAAENAGYPLAMAGTGELGALIHLGASMDLQPAVHAIGDRANHVLMNWYAELEPAQRAAMRPRIEHAQHLLPSDVRRFAELGVIPSMQPLHKADDGRYAEQRLGPERVRTSYAFRDLLDSGAMLAFGSDWPVVSINPFLGMHAAVAGLTIEGDVFLPEQSITVEEALRCYTQHAAYALHAENETGRIRAWHRADFVMLDRDILTVPTDELPETRVVRTVVGGRTVYLAENIGGQD